MRVRVCACVRVCGWELRKAGFKKMGTPRRNNNTLGPHLLLRVEEGLRALREVVVPLQPLQDQLRVLHVGRDIRSGDTRSAGNEGQGGWCRLG